MRRLVPASEDGAIMRAASSKTRHGVVHALTAGFFTMTMWCLVGGITVTAITALSGPHRWATAIRAAIRIGGVRARFRSLMALRAALWPRRRTHRTHARLSGTRQARTRRQRSPPVAVSGNPKITPNDLGALTPSAVRPWIPG